MPQKRQSFGEALIRHQAIGFKLADMATQIEAARLMVWKCRKPERRRPALPAAGEHGKAVCLGDG